MSRARSFVLALAALTAQGAVLGCGGGQQEPATPEGPLPMAEPKSSGETPTDTGEGGEGTGSPDDPLAAKAGQFDEKSAETVLERGKRKAVQCPDVVPDGPRGEVEVQVTFDGQKGRVTEATVPSPFEGTTIGQCVVRAFVGEIIPPFDGDPKTMSVQLELAEKKPAAGGKKK